MLRESNRASTGHRIGICGNEGGQERERAATTHVAGTAGCRTGWLRACRRGARAGGRVSDYLDRFGAP